MEAASPVHGDIAFTAIETRSALHTPASTDSAEFEQAVEHWAVIPHIEASLFLLVRLHIVWRHLLQEIDVLVRMELSHFEVRRRLGTLEAVSDRLPIKELSCETQRTECENRA